jgi:hypothetical protein
MRAASHVLTCPTATPPQVPAHPSTNILVFVRYVSTFTAAAAVRTYRAVWPVATRSPASGVAPGAPAPHAPASTAPTKKGHAPTKDGLARPLMLAIGLVEVAANTIYGLGTAYAGSAYST